MEEQPEPRKGFVARVGTFFILIGIGLMLFFILSKISTTPEMNYFCWSAVLIILGLALQGRFKKPPVPPSGRFSVVGKIKTAIQEEKQSGGGNLFGRLKAALKSGPKAEKK